MTSPQAVLSVEAQNDLHEIEAYIIKQSGELRAADIRGRLQRAMNSLAFMPGMGRSRPYLPSRLRAFPVPPWIVVYRTLLSGDDIVIQRILDGRRDLAAIFKKKKRRR